MEPIIIEPQTQKDAADCGVACLSMLCGVSFAAVMEALPARRRKLIANVEGMSIRQMRQVARKLGRPLRWIDEGTMPADSIGILGLSRPISKDVPGGKREGHYVIYVRGTIYNPAENMWWMEADAFCKTRRWEPEGILVRTET